MSGAAEEKNKAKEERRREILDAAAQLFAEKGYDATTVSEIVQKVGVAQGTFYLYFPSKAHIRKALHEKFHDEIIKASMEKIAVSDDSLKKIEIAVNVAFEYMAKNQNLIRELFHQNHSSCEFEQESRDLNKKMAQPLAAIIRNGVEKGEIKTANPEIAAYLIIGMIERIALEALLWQEPGTLEEIIPEVHSFIRKALS